MIPNGSYRAVLDRFEDELAVLEISDEQSRHELAVDQHELPQPARHVDAILEVELLEGALADAEYKPEESAQRAEEAQDRFNRLSSRPPDDGNS